MDPHAHSEVDADPVKFEEAIRAFRARVPMTDAEFEQLVEAEREFAFTVAGVAQAELVADAYEAVQRAIEEGTDLETFKAEVGAALEESWGGERPGRIECLPGDNLVSGAVIRAAHRRRYEGRIVEVVTARGRKFTATPNHPMLTRRGWVAAGKLREGDDLIGYRGQQDHGSPGHQDEKEPPASIAQVFDALARSRVVERVHGHRLDFHGDGADGKVDVVAADRPLMFGDFAPLRKPLEQLAFPVADLSRPRFCPRCEHLVVVTQRCGFCDRPVRRARALQALANRIVARAEVMSDRVRAFASQISRQQLLDLQIFALAGWGATTGEVKTARSAQLARHAGLLDRLRHPHDPGRHGRRHLPDASAAEIEFDRVCSVRFGMFGGHVFNLSTAHGYYALNGIYTGNTIFRTNVMTAYNAGRYSAATAPAVKRERPYWRFDGVEDSRTTEEICEPIIQAKVLLAADHAWWQTHYPPLHYQCRSVVTTLTEEQARDQGITDSPPTVDVMPGFGAAPSSGGTDWVPDTSDLPGPIGDLLQDQLD